MDLTGLNREQRLAVETTQGPVLILAGAGSGKTRALTHRIAYLLDEKHISPFEILALTFTNKAAREMKERVEGLSDFHAQNVWVSTFHACCAKMLRIDIERMPGFTRDFVIYDETDQLSLITQVQEKLKLKEDYYPKRLLRSIFSDAKNRSLKPLEYIAATNPNQTEIYVNAFEQYQLMLRQNNALDFDDLLLRTLELFDTNPEILHKYQERFRFIHVDEYQDTNIMQYRFVKLLSKVYRNLCVVGDDDQSIYGWRGADLRNILDFEKDFPDATVIRMEQNYRSTKNILNAANAVIGKNIDRKSKKLWTEKEEGTKIGLYTAWSEKDEADYVCKTINSLSQTGYSNADFAVLYRTNAQSRVLEDMFVAYGIPYTVHGSLRFYDRKEIKDVLAYLRLMINPHDEVALRRIINVPKRGIGDASVNELSAIAEEKGISLFEAALTADQLDLSGRAKGKMLGFAQLLVQIRALFELLPLSDFVQQLLELTGYWKYLEEEKRKEGKQDETRIENVQELIHAITEFETNAGENTLNAFLENVALVANISDETAGSSVTLMTMHSAKGLEFPIVFITGMEENIFPSSRAIQTAAGLEEERRLCYVGITRAKEKLYICHAKKRFQYNNISTNMPSRFLKEIPDELLDVDETSAQSSCDTYGWQSPERSTRSWDTSSSKVTSGTSTTANFVATQKPILGGAAWQPSKPAEIKKNGYQFSKDQKVKHARFGEGKILEVEGGVLTIDFAQQGVKKIVGAYAPIEPLE